MVEKVLIMCPMPCSKSFRQKHVERLSKQVVRLVAEQ